MEKELQVICVYSINNKYYNKIQKLTSGGGGGGGLLFDYIKFLNYSFYISFFFIINFYTYP